MPRASRNTSVHLERRPEHQYRPAERKTSKTRASRLRSRRIRSAAEHLERFPEEIGRLCNRSRRQLHAPAILLPGQDLEPITLPVLEGEPVPGEGSSPRTCRTRALRPSNDLRRSAGSAHRKMRMVGERLSMKRPPARPGGRGAPPGRSPAECEGTAPGEEELKRRSLVAGVVLDVNGEEGNETGGLGIVRQAVALLECASPGIEGRNG